MERNNTKWVVIGSVAGALLLIVIVVGAALLTPAKTAGAAVLFTSAEPTQGVEVRVGNAAQGNTPFTANLAPGQYTYIASLPGYRPATGEFVIEPGTGSVEVRVPTLTPLGGQILVRCNAAAKLFVDGNAAGVCSTAGWASLGLYPAGRYQVRAVAPLGEQTREAIVYDTVDAQVDFKWGARLVVTVEPAEVTATVVVDGKPYNSPAMISADDLASRSFVQVEVAAPGYISWSDDVFLRPGETVTASATLEIDTRPQDILGAYWNFWRVWNEAGRTLDPAPLSGVMTGEMLEKQTTGFAALGEFLSSWGISPAPHTPTLTIVSETTVTLRATFDATQTAVQKNGARSVTTDRWDGVFTLVLGADGVWRVASWKSMVAAEPTQTQVAGGPTPAPGGPTPVSSGPTPGGEGGAYPPADRGLVAQVILGSINCVRAEAGLAPATLDTEAMAALAPLVEEATTTFRNTRSYPPELQARVLEVAHALGVRVVLWSGETMSYVPGAAQWGIDPFEGDWANYVDHPCDTLWATWRRDDWTQSFSRVGIALGTPYIDGNRYRTTIIVVVR